MKERPILFNGAMVNALLAGTKTQTRRVVKRPKAVPLDYVLNPRLLVRTFMTWWQPSDECNAGRSQVCPYGQPGDRLWVRETFALSVVDPDGGPPEDDPENYDVIYRATDTPGGGWTDGEGNTIAAPWKPSIHMPRWASRILLEITSVRVERLQDISEDDCWAEGIDAVDGTLDDMAILDLAKRMNRSCHDAAPTYAALWESINGAGSWDTNPFVWVVAFKRVAP